MFAYLQLCLLSSELHAPALHAWVLPSPACHHGPVKSPICGLASPLLEQALCMAASCLRHPWHCYVSPILALQNRTDAFQHTSVHPTRVALSCTLQFLEGLSGWRRRWTMVLLCFVAFMLCNMDRVNMSIAILPMSQQYGWDSQTVGFVQSSFFW